MRLFLENKECQYSKVIENVKDFHIDDVNKRVVISYPDGKTEWFRSEIYAAREMSDEEFLDFANKSTAYLGGMVNRFCEENKRRDRYNKIVRLVVLENKKVIAMGSPKAVAKAVKDKATREANIIESNGKSVTLAI